MRNLLFKTLYDRRGFIIGWVLGLAFLGYLMTLFYPAFHQDGGLDQLVKSLPPAFKGLVGDLANLNSLPTYLGSQLFDVRMPIFASVLAILLSVGLTVGEEEKGLLRTLSALPLSRSRILIDKWLSIVIVCVITIVALAGGVELGLLQIHNSIDIAVLARLCGLMLLLMVALASLIFAVGMITGRRGITTAIGILVAVGSFILTTFATSVDWLKNWEKLSILHYYPAPDIAKGTVEPSNIWVYVAIIVISLVAATVVFRRRDLN